jgi:hypothetical protein
MADSRMASQGASPAVPFGTLGKASGTHMSLQYYFPVAQVSSSVLYFLISTTSTTDQGRNFPHKSLNDVGHLRKL